MALTIAARHLDGLPLLRRSRRWSYRDLRSSGSCADGNRLRRALRRFSALGEDGCEEHRTTLFNVVSIPISMGAAIAERERTRLLRSSPLVLGGCRYSFSGRQIHETKNDGILRTCREAVESELQAVRMSRHKMVSAVWRDLLLVSLDISLRYSLRGSKPPQR